MVSFPPPSPLLCIFILTTSQNLAANPEEFIPGLLTGVVLRRPFQIAKRTHFHFHYHLHMTILACARARALTPNPAKRMRTCLLLILSLGRGRAL